MDMSDYTPIEISEHIKCTGIIAITSHSFYYTPAFDPPPYDINPIKNNINPRRHIVERLTLGSVPKNTFPLYDFNGDFYLKFIALECYGIH